MKKLVVALSVTALLAASSAPSAQAGDKEWATAGKVLTGLIAASVLTDAVSSHHQARHTTRTTVYSSPSYTHQPVVVQQPTYVQQQPVFVQQPTYVQQQPVVVHQQPVYVQQPTICRTAPVVVHQPAPVVVHQHRSYVAPRPVVSFQFGRSWGNSHQRHYHGHRGRGHRYGY